MSPELAEIYARRARLVARAAAERDELAGHIRHWEGAWAMGRRGFAIANTLVKRSPLLGTLLGVGVTALVTTKPGLAATLMRALPIAWRLAGSVTRLVSGFFK